MNEARISFEGNIGSEPEIKFLPSGQAVCEFSVAVNQRKKVNEEWKDTNTSWFRLACWGKLAESAVELKKGSRVLVVGTLVAQELDGRNQCFQTLHGWWRPAFFGEWSGYRFSPATQQHP